MLQFRGQMLAVEGEIGKLRERLKEHDDSVPTKKLDPHCISPSRWANRHPDAFNRAEFARLRQDIELAGGNVQPISVRALPGQVGRYEIVFGHRRHRACSELGLPVLATIDTSASSDLELFSAMDRENRGRKNLSAWEQGRMYDEAIRKGLYPSLRRLAEALGVNLSDASRAVQLAKLPKDIVVAFATPLDLQVRWAKPLADALQRDPEGTLARARSAMALGASRKPAEVLGLLLAAPAQPQPRDIAIRQGAKPVAILKLAANGKLTIEFEAGAVPDGQIDALAKLIEGFLTTTLPA